MSDDPTPREVLIALQGHMATDSLLTKIVLAFMGATIAALLGAAAYLYNSNEELKAAQVQSAQASIASEHQAAVDASALTTRRLGDTPSAQQGVPTAADAP